MGSTKGFPNGLPDVLFVLGGRWSRATVDDGQMQDGQTCDLILPNGFGDGFAGR